MLCNTCGKEIPDESRACPFCTTLVTMDINSALRILELSGSESQGEKEEQYHRKHSETSQLIQNAPTRLLRDRYIQMLNDVKEAGEILFGKDSPITRGESHSDLPSAIQVESTAGSYQEPAPQKYTEDPKTEPYYSPEPAYSQPEQAPQQDLKQQEQPADTLGASVSDTKEKNQLSVNSIKKFIIELWKTKKGKAAIIGILAFIILMMIVLSDNTKAYGPFARGNLQRTGYYPQKGKESFELTSAWNISLDSRAAETPVVYKGIIYFSDARGTLHAVDVLSGTEKWNSKISDGDPIGSPSISGGKIFLGSNSGTIHALDIKTGDTIWTYDTNGMVTTSPAVYKGLVLTGSNDGYFYAVKSWGKGGLEWKFNAEGPIKATAAVYEGKVFFGTTEGTFYALNCNDSKQVWSFTVNNKKILTTPAVYDDKVFFGVERDNFYALDSNKGTIIWKTPVEGRVTAACVENDIVYYCTTNQYGTISQVVACNADTGAIIWSTAIEGSIACDPVITDTFLCVYDYTASKADEYDDYGYYVDSVTSYRVNLGIYNIKDGSCQNRFRIYSGSRLGSSPAIDKGVLFFRSGTDGSPEFAAMKSVKDDKQPFKVVPASEETAPVK